MVVVSSIIGLFGLRGIEYLLKDGKKGYFGGLIGQSGLIRRMNIAQNTVNLLFLKVEGDVWKLSVYSRIEIRRLINSIGT